MKKPLILLLISICIVFLMKKTNAGNYPDLILFNGKIITVDKNFSIAQAAAIQGDRIRAVGTNREIEKLAGSSTKKIDLKGKTVIPGLMDNHVHPEGASVSELSGEIPVVHSVGELLDWIKGKAGTKKPGEWIIHPKLFPTRLKEMRQPSKEELDMIAPENPVFLNGSHGGMVNSAAIRVSNLTKDTKHPGVLKEPDTGEPSGFLQRSAFRLLKGIPERKLKGFDRTRKTC